MFWVRKGDRLPFYVSLRRHRTLHPSKPIGRPWRPPRVSADELLRRTRTFSPEPAFHAVLLEVCILNCLCDYTWLLLAINYCLSYDGPAGEQCPTWLSTAKRRQSRGMVLDGRYYPRGFSGTMHTYALECVDPTDGGGGVWRMGLCWYQRCYSEIDRSTNQSRH